jgi:very-short-patch-repair endonuclease
MKWTEEQIIQLRELYPSNKTDVIVNIMNLSKKSIESKAKRLGLKRTIEHKSKMISNRNKIVGTNITYEVMRETALKYKTRGEFQRLDASIYTTTRKYGLLDEVCSHMVKSNYSIPQLMLYYIICDIFKCEVIYNTKDIIPPYELDIFIPKYNIAFEYDGKYWHDNNKKDLVKDKICNENNIKLLRIVENSRDYIQDIEEQLMKNINFINIYLNEKINSINIDKKYIYKKVNDSIDDLESIKCVISKYIYYDDFRKNEINTYNKLLRRKILEELTSNLIKKRIVWTEQNIKNEVSKYKYLCDLIKNSPTCYNHIKKNKKDYFIKNLIRKN